MAPTESKPEEKKPKCGIIMPIAGSSLIYTAQHWKDVFEILKDAIGDTGFDADLVSNDTAAGLIHERIVKNIYENEIVICDVSSKNPNVMFELGMRLAFDKPTIVVKDDTTDYSFDIGGIEHLQYPISLRFADIVQFKKTLFKKVIDTYKRSKEDINYSPFLKTFGHQITPSTIPETNVSQNEFIVEKLSALGADLSLIRRELVYGEIPRRKEQLLRAAQEIPYEVIEKYLKKNHTLVTDRALSDFDRLESLRIALAMDGTFLQDSTLQAYVEKYQRHDI